MASSLHDLIEDVTQDGCRIVREAGQDMLLSAYYTIYNQQCFDGTLPEMPIFWAKSISLSDGGHPMALYVSEESPVRRRYIVLDEKLSSMFPLERLSLLHEMVHVKIEPISGHGDEFIAEFKRVLDANHWEVMGCIDLPKLQEST
jgi:hypothetical protein